MESTDIDGVFDSVLVALGWNGRYQVFQIFLVMVCSLPVEFNIMNIDFIGHHVQSHCKEINDTLLFRDNGVDMNTLTINITYGECGITWNLVCGKESLSDLLQTLFTVGRTIGALVFTRLADRKGRKISHCLAGLFLLISSTVLAFIPSYVPYAILKVFQGAAESGISLSATTITLEVVPSSHKTTLGALWTLEWTLCVAFYAAAAYFMRGVTWRHHQLISGLTAVYYLTMPWLLDESMRWLIAKKKFNLAESNLRKAARINGKNEDEIVLLFKDRISEVDIEEQHTDTVNVSTKEELHEEKDPLLQIFTDKNLLLITAVMWFMWLTDSLAYHGLSLTSTEFHSDKYIGFGLSSIMDVISAPAFWLTVERFGRKKTTFGYHILAGIALIMSSVFQTYVGMYPSFSTAVTTLSLLGKFAIATSFNILWVYTPEVYPTPVRNFSFGPALVVGTIGGFFAPFSRTLYRHRPWVLGAIFGSFCITVSVLVRFLPETGSQELLQTIDDMKKLVKVKTLHKQMKKKTKDIRKNEFKAL